MILNLNRDDAELVYQILHDKTIQFDTDYREQDRWGKTVPDRLRAIVATLEKDIEAETAEKVQRDGLRSIVIGVVTDEDRYWLISQDELRRLAATPHKKRLELLDELDLPSAKISSDGDVHITIVLDEWGSHDPSPESYDEVEFQNRVAELLE